jgi:hypothetical protein
MNNIEAVEKVIAGLTDKHDRAVARIAEIAAERQRLAFTAYATEDKAARVRLDQLRADAVFMNGELADINDAIAEANERLAAARNSATRTDAQERTLRVHKLLDELLLLGPQLDEKIGAAASSSPAMPTAEGPRFLNNPPLRLKAAALLGSLFIELKALKLDNGASFPARLWDVAARQDLLLALSQTIHAGWPSELQRLTHSDRSCFVGLFGALARIIRARLGEQTEKAA